MNSKLQILAIAIVFLSCSFRFGFLGYCQGSQERFIYDAQSKRDPFIPLTDKKQPTGLREEFRPPQVKAKLPVQIKVEGILWKGEQAFAILNGKVFKKGQNLGEVRIKEIEKDRVILEYGAREFTLFLRKEKEE